MNTALKKYTNFESEEFEGVEQCVTIVKDQLEVLGQMFHNFNSKDFFWGAYGAARLSQSCGRVCSAFG